MRRALLLAVVVLALGASEAEANVLTGDQARLIFLRAEPHGRFHGCQRVSAPRLDCRIEVRDIAVHEWLDPTTGEWVIEGRQVFYTPAIVPIYRGGVAWDSAKV